MMMTERRESFWQPTTSVQGKFGLVKQSGPATREKWPR
jgi:hypothetical protein